MVGGSCLCGGVAWQAGGRLEWMTHCHCSMCRKIHGTAFATYLAGPAESFRWLQGAELVERYRSSAGFDRPFCSRCGSVVPEEPDEGRVFMPAGNLDDDPIARPVAHIFVASKAPWHRIGDALPRFDEAPPDRPMTAIDRPAAPAPSRPGALRGSCLCGDAVFEVSGDVRGIVKCHCSRCRKARSAAHASNLIVERADFRWLQGAEGVRGYKVPEAARFSNHFCARCGSILPRSDPDPQRIGVPAGSLDGSGEGVVEKLHIYVGSKAPWYEIADDLPQRDEVPWGSGANALPR